MPYKQEPRLDFWNVLKRRKRSIRNFLETNGIDDVQKFNNWLKTNSSEYIFSEEFKKEVFNHFGDKKHVTENNEQKAEIAIVPEVKTEEESDPYPSLPVADLPTEIEFTVTAPVDPSEDTDYSAKENKKNKKKKSYSFEDA